MKPLPASRYIAWLLSLLGGVSLSAQNTTIFQVTSGTQVTSIVVSHQAPAPVGDADRNGLPDIWELQYFGRIGVNSAGDADGDGSTNLQEFQAGTDPITPPFDPADTDHDGLPDAWEQRYFGTLDYGPGDQFNSMDRTLLEYYQQGVIPRLYSPAVVAGLRAWYRADSGWFTDPISGGVRLWADISGNGFHLRQSMSTAQPYFISSESGEQFMSFDGARRLTAVSADVLAEATDLTVFAVMRPADSQAADAALATLGTGTSEGFSLKQIGTSLNHYALIWPRASGQGLQGGVAAVAAAANTVQLLTFAKSGTSQASYLNGELQATTTVAADLNAAPAALSLGGLSGGAFSGAVYDVLIYNRMLSPAERMAVEDQLLRKNRIHDLDHNGLPDRWERNHFGQTGIDPDVDADHDGLNNRDEYVFSTDPTAADTDGDGYGDGQELSLGTDPTDSTSKGVDQVTWLVRYTTATSSSSTGIAFWPGVSSFLGTVPTYGKVEWSLTRSGASQGNGLYRIVMELGSDLASWTIDKQFGGLDGLYGAGTFWIYLPQGASSHASLPFSWDGIAGFGGVRTDSAAAATRYGGTLTETALSWTESWPYLDDNGQLRHYTNDVAMNLSRPQDPVYATVPGQTSTSAWTVGAPSISRSTGSEGSAEYQLLVPAGTAGTIRWLEVFTPADGSVKIYTIREWIITNGATASPVFTLSCPVNGTAEVMSLDLPQLAVDANRDNVIILASEDASDATTTASPYRFWLNDDDDGTPMDEDDHVGSTHKDYEDLTITSRRDLEDFAQMHVYLGGMEDAVTNGQILVGLKWKNTAGTPAINIYKAIEADGGTKYLTDLDTASQQAPAVNLCRVVPNKDGNYVSVDTSGTFIFDPSFWSGLSASGEKKYLLFEGAGEGSGQLVLVLLKPDGTEISEGPGVWMDLRNVKSMYQGPGTTFVQPADETSHGIVFVHGWNMSAEGSSNFVETVFKRLWHRGYKGRFVYFRWNTNYSDTFDNVPVIGAAVEGYLADYNGSERVAWQSGPALKAVVEALPSGYSRNVIAHSMGNIVVGSALLSGMAVNNYVLMQAAVPASCYDERDILKQPERESEDAYPGVFGVGFHPTFWEADASPDDDPVSETRALAYRGRLSADRGNLVSFYLTNDAATTYAWEFNNDQFKPATSYHYDRGAPPSPLGTQQAIWKPMGTGPSMVKDYLNDPYEAMPLACRSWSKLVGAENRTAGAIKGSLDLGSETFSLPGETLGFKDEHSAEFNRNIQVLKPFYDALLSQFSITPNP